MTLSRAITRRNGSGARKSCGLTNLTRADVVCSGPGTWVKGKSMF